MKIQTSLLIGAVLVMLGQPCLALVDSARDKLPPDYRQQLKDLRREFELLLLPASWAKTDAQVKKMAKQMKSILYHMCDIIVAHPQDATPEIKQFVFRHLGRPETRTMTNITCYR